jgi:hypothetical protein
MMIAAIILGWFAVSVVVALLLGRLANRLKGPR